MSLKNYLEQINNNQPIDFNKFLNNFPKQFLKEKERWRDFFEVKSMGNNLQKISILDEQFFVTLLEHVEKPTNRIHAATLGDSHQHPVTVNLILVYHDALLDLRPEIVYLTAYQTIQTFQSKKQLLLIENEETFFHYKKMCALASTWLKEEINLHNTDIALGSGNKMTTQLRREWYAQYERVLCMFDYDLGGLEMFKTLKKHLQNQIIFVQPSNYKNWFKFFKKIEKSEKISKAHSLAIKLNFHELATAFLETKKFMEQEVLLSPEIENDE
jgi:5S rRNA maturation endonuclease (ribonuclease M5)